MIPELRKLKHTGSGNFFLLAGPCVIEDTTMAFPIAERLCKISDKLNIPLVFKASFKKANRTRVDSFMGIGDENALKILEKVGEQFDIPVVTDIHTSDDAKRASQYVDILQIPAFLCRQTDLLLSAARTGRIVNIKKGQFLSGDSMKYAVEKVKGAANNGVMLTERGSMFGYGDLVVDYRNIIAMKSFNVPVVMDVTHSLQQPNQKSGVTGGQPELIETIARAGIAVGADGIFMETHPNPGKAKSDGANMLQLDLVEDLMTRLVSLRKVINEFGE
ncbi:MAG: 3-deoxy-8-phosphooctulonate synthase [Lentimicrobiaceae bacterium]|jgi:2-dehydro-3-deoxyphosphooctonate aldolase (KDO 8-P synthase)|nr:3-deoxy-8-phosphooctulonate synthase [Lentimicrobiaceae bacterium]MDG1900832.1 3-deoxy-8-phosphooctulonate synthase [Bacteroidales bacterium]MDG2080858.1 3-deoxy-8-phosphooctulonate synthase [Bacteroidales bacterium]|tara:strand:- start:3228 stop:4052 length:825 start_codon:yes stop_codon:yes gene_type:complete